MFAMGDLGEPSVPAPARRERLVVVLAELIARGGARPFLAPPVVPGAAAFPEPWRPTRGGVVALLRRLAWHAGNPRAIHVVDERLGAPPTERKPETRVGLTSVRAKELWFRIEFLGDDDVAGTLAHELGVAHAAASRPDAADPYRDAERPVIEVEAERDLERGSVATVYLGLGAVAANAAFQQYSRAGRFNGGYTPLEYDVLCAGYAPDVRARVLARGAGRRPRRAGAAGALAARSGMRSRPGSRRCDREPPSCARGSASPRMRTSPTPAPTRSGSRTSTSRTTRRRRAGTRSGGARTGAAWAWSRAPCSGWASRWRSPRRARRRGSCSAPRARAT